MTNGHCKHLSPFQGRGERAYDIFSRLLKERIICLMGPVRGSLVPRPERGPGNEAR